MSESRLAAAAWPAVLESDAIATLARLRKWGRELPPAPDLTGLDADQRQKQVRLWAEQGAIDVDPVSITYADLDAFLREATPYILPLVDPEATPGDPFSTTVLVVLRADRRHLWCLSPDETPRPVPIATVRAKIAAPLEETVREESETVVAAAGLQGRAAVRARDALMLEQLGHRSIEIASLVRLSPRAPLRHQIADAGIWRLTFLALMAQVIAQGVVILSWLTLGDLSLLGGFAWGWVDAWSLLLLTSIPATAAAFWAEQLAVLKLGALIKRLLLYGITRLDPDTMRAKGSGQFLGLAMEADALELAGLGGGLLAIFAIARLFMVATLLALVDSGLILIALLVVWIVGAGVIGVRLWRHTQAWAQTYHALAGDLQERMAGHRTYIVQLPRGDWYAREDRLLADYWGRSLAVDNHLSFLVGGFTRSWLFVGMVGLALILWAGLTDIGEIGIIILAVLYGQLALTMIGRATPSLVQLAVAARELSPLFQAARRERKDAASDPTLEQPTDSDAPLLAGRDLSFRHPGARTAAVEDAHFEIRDGDRILLEGPSGGGKSTFAALLSGLLHQETGSLTWHGIERAAFPASLWHQRILNVPQFHENHVFAATFAFNLLMGRRWPPTEEDLREADQVCRELGLGPLIDHMPGGLQQMVGEAGWALSHGERSRLFVARALLQDADLVILDESFASLDPETLRKALGCVLSRARTVMVIAHP